MLDPLSVSLGRFRVHTHRDEEVADKQVPATGRFGNTLPHSREGERPVGPVLYQSLCDEPLDMVGHRGVGDAKALGKMTRANGGLLLCQLGDHLHVVLRDLPAMRLTHEAEVPRTMLRR